VAEFAYGGIVVNDNRQILMRSPNNHWGGYLWTFAKGSLENSDINSEQAALREVREETGYECSIITEIPGEFESDTCITKYYLMKPTGKITEYDEETQDVQWFTPDEAFEKINLTKTEKGRKRDREALISALQTMELIDKTS
jgi:8-oxo-dGTP pyrophosphatase MutT (NUDIX family)